MDCNKYLSRMRYYVTDVLFLSSLIQKEMKALGKNELQFVISREKTYT